MSNEHLIFADDISYSYSSGFHFTPASVIINHISFTLNRGEILAFLGPNGAGKSTTMRMLTGNLPCHSGNIFIAGYNLKKQPIKAKQNIGYLADTPPLYADLKVDEYLNYCAKLHGLTAQQAKSAMQNVKQRCGLNSYGKHLIAHLSKGIGQRIGIAQAIIHQPDIIILDEPSNGLDPVQRHEILNLIKELGDLHSVILSTHSWSDVKQAGCDKVQIINQGELVYQDSINQLEKQLQSQNIIVHCQQSINRAINKERIKNIEGIIDVEKINSLDNCFRINCHPSSDVVKMQQISSTIVSLSEQENWQLYEIKIEQRSFDEVFLSLATN